MRRLIGCLAVLLALASSTAARSLDVPPRPTGRVNDYAGVLPAADRSRLEARLAEIDRETSTQIIVALFPSLGGDDLEGFSMRLAEAWRPGTAERDNGLIILVFTGDRRVRMEVGKGLEGVVPDILAGRIIRDVIGPRFRAGDYAGGLAAAVEAVHQASRGEYVPPKAARNPLSPWMAAVILLGFVGLVVMLLKLSRRLGGPAIYRGRHHGPWGTGGFGGGFGGGGFDSGGFGGGFSGGGGGFGGGGASGSW